MPGMARTLCTPKNKGIFPHWELNSFFAMQILRKANTAALSRGCKPRKVILHVSLFTKQQHPTAKLKNMEFESCNLCLKNPCNLLEISVLTLIKRMIVSLTFLRTREKRKAYLQCRGQKTSCCTVSLFPVAEVAHFHT